jgi:Asp-tRNA(Asn)/Glu-tRNA(Gln) amidotransferase A subunit family amidase
MTSATQAAQSANARIALRDGDVHAFVHHDPQAVLHQAHEIDGREAELPLRGVTFGIKDIFDTSDMPTEYGSRAWRGHVPARDAEVVRRMRAAGALIVGKAATTEFAYMHAAATVNPHNLLHTPGGSSSGSAAAVADGMVDVALGSQTGGSTIRPSAYCGIVGFKPTHGVIPLDGVKRLAPSMDTVGLHARSVHDIQRLFAILAARQPDAAHTAQQTTPHATPLIRWCPGPFADQADAASHRTLTAARVLLEQCGLPVTDLELGQEFAALNNAQLLLMAYEGSLNLRMEYEERRSDISAESIRLIESGRAATATEVQQARMLAGRWREQFAALMGEHSVLLTFSAPGEAPVLADGTGNSIFNRSWTLLGVPAITLPFGRGPQGLPLGIQLIAGPGCDGALLACAQTVEAAMNAPPVESARGAARDTKEFAA